MAWVNLGTGLVNVVLSILLIGRFGLPGVAWGTLIPIAVSAMFILYPAACRRVGVPLTRAFAQSVFPALWPALHRRPGCSLFTRHISSGTLLAVVSQAALGGVVYLALFFTVAIGKRDRADYIAKVAQRDAAPPAPAGRQRLAEPTRRARGPALAPTRAECIHAWDHPRRGQRLAAQRHSWRIAEVPGQGRAA